MRRCYDRQSEMLESLMVFYTQAAPVLQPLFFLARTAGDFCWNRLSILLGILNGWCFLLELAFDFAGSGD